MSWSSEITSECSECGAPLREDGDCADRGCSYSLCRECRDKQDGDEEALQSGFEEDMWKHMEE